MRDRRALASDVEVTFFVSLDVFAVQDLRARLQRLPI